MNTRIIFFIFVLISNSAFSQTAFKKISPLLPTFPIFQIAQTDNNHIILAGDSHSVIRLNLDNFSYTLTTINNPSIIISMQFTDSLNGWFASSSGDFWRTIDGGLTWQNITVPVFSDFASIYFTGKDTGWIAGPHVFLRTTDGGLTWDNFSVQSLPPLYRIVFKSNFTGFVSSYDGRLYKTTDAGRNWATVYQGNDLITDICFTSDTIIWACTDSGRILRSSDAGLSWQSNYISAPKKQLNKIAFRTDRYGVCTDIIGNIYITTNAGTSWTTYSSGFKYNIFTFSFLKNGDLFCADTDANYFTSSDSGKSWHIFKETKNTLYSGRQLKKGVFLFCGEKGTIALNQYNGIKWEWMPSPTGNVFLLKDIVIPDTFFVLIAATNGYLLLSYNSAKSWSFVNTGFSQQINRLFFINKSTGWFVGSGGGIGYTNDFGLTWQLQNSILGINLNSIYFINADTGWAVGSYGMLKTTNHGITWDVLPEWRGNFNDVYFRDALNGFAVTERGEIFTSTDGGNNWSKREFFNSSFNRIYFQNPNTGWIIGKRGAVLKSTDSGSHWNPIETGITNELNGIVFYDSLSGMICGSEGIVLKTTNGGITFSEDGESNIITSHLKASCYPQPFSSEITIHYSVHQPGYVSLVIYNSLGEKVQSLTNEEQPAGTYDVKFNGAEKAAGVYFYRLVSGKEIITGKMLMVK